MAFSPNAVTTNTSNNPYLKRAYAISNPDEGRSVYDDWAAQFDQDMRSEALDYVAPAITARKVLQYCSPGSAKIDKSLEILDAGCGTGLAGVKIAELGAEIVDGIDLSQGMLDVAAKTGVYRTLEPADLSKPIARPGNTYDALVCVGTLTHGHVGPEALMDFTRVVKKGGYVVSTVLGDIWESHGYKSEIERLEREGKVQVMEADLDDYRRGSGVKAIMLVFLVK